MCKQSWNQTPGFIVYVNVSICVVHHGWDSNVVMLINYQVNKQSTNDIAAVFSPHGANICVPVAISMMDFFFFKDHNCKFLGMSFI